MQLDATQGAPMAAGWFGGSNTEEALKRVDVTHTANSLMFHGEVFMDAEAFGVAVTRRQEARKALNTVERTRLLDVLCHAEIYRGACQSEAKAFQVWLVPTDAQDGKVRLTWFQIRKDSGSYVIELNDF